jgi:hypothetical protein
VKTVRLRTRTRLVVSLLACSVGVACAARKQETRATNTPSCPGSQTVVVHNGTLQTLEVVLSHSRLSDRLVDVIAPGQRSTALPMQRAGTSLHVRELGTTRVIDYRDPRVRYEYGCKKLT